MEDRGTCIIIIAMIFFLSAPGVNSLQCHSCVNCNSTNVKTVTCSIPSTNTTTTTSSSSSSSSSTTATPSSSSTSTTTPSTTTSSSTTAPAALLYPAESKNRIERSIDFEDYFSDVQESDCKCNDGVCDCVERATSLTNLTFVCVTDKRSVNGVTITDKGCGVDLNNVTASCLVSGYSSQCKICSKDLCNFGTTLTISAILLIPAMLITLFK